MTEAADAALAGDEESRGPFVWRVFGGWRPFLAILFSLAGIGVSIYVTILHYAKVAPVCGDTGAINCEKVLTSPQSIVFGIPVPVYGLLWFISMLALNLPVFWRTRWWWLPWARVVWAVAGIGFAFNLIYDELFVIRNICLWCTGAHVLAFGIFVVVVTGWAQATEYVERRAV